MDGSPGVRAAAQALGEKLSDRGSYSAAFSSSENTRMDGEGGTVTESNARSEYVAIAIFLGAIPECLQSPRIGWQPRFLTVRRSREPTCPRDSAEKSRVH